MAKRQTSSTLRPVVQAAKQVRQAIAHKPVPAKKTIASASTDDWEEF
jgi:hypothetical protein